MGSVIWGKFGVISRKKLQISLSEPLSPVAPNRVVGVSRGNTIRGNRTERF